MCFAVSEMPINIAVMKNTSLLLLQPDLVYYWQVNQCINNLWIHYNLKNLTFYVMCVCIFKGGMKYTGQDCCHWVSFPSHLQISNIV